MKAWRGEPGADARGGVRGPGRLAACGLAAALLLAIGVAAATTYVAMTVAEMVEAAEIAIFAEVRDVQSFERDGRPWTRVTLTVERDLIAAAAEARETPADPPAGGGEDGEPTEVELEFLGGALPGGPSLAVAGMPGFEPGERVLVLAYDQDSIASPIVGFRQGLWRVVGDSLVDEGGRILGVEDGELVPGGTPSPVAAVLDVLIERFGDLP